MVGHLTDLMYKILFVKVVGKNFKRVNARSFTHIGLMSRVFANSPGDRDSIPIRVIPNTKKNGT